MVLFAYMEFIGVYAKENNIELNERQEAGIKTMEKLSSSLRLDMYIRQSFAELKDGKEYDNLYATARCREWADWLVGINATRLFSVLYHRTLNVGRVVSPKVHF